MRKMDVTCNVVADPEKKLTKNGREYVAIRVVNSEFNDKKDGKDVAYWINVNVFNPMQIAFVMNYVKKGSRLIVSGDYSASLYTNANGVTSILHTIMGNSIYFNTTDGGQQQGGGNQQTQQKPQAHPQPLPTTAQVEVSVNTDMGADDDLPF